MSVSSRYLLIDLGETDLLRQKFSKEWKWQRSHCDPSVFFTTTGPGNHPHTNKSSPVSQCDPLERIKHGSLDLMTCWPTCLSTCGSSLCLVEMATCKPLCSLFAAIPKYLGAQLRGERTHFVYGFSPYFPMAQNRATHREGMKGLQRGRKQGCGREKGERREGREREMEGRTKYWLRVWPC